MFFLLKTNILFYFKGILTTGRVFRRIRTAARIGRVVSRLLSTTGGVGNGILPLSGLPAAPASFIPDTLETAVDITGTV